MLKRLSEREREVAVAVGRGRSNAEISDELFMSVATVKAHVSSMLTKLNLNNRHSDGAARPRRRTDPLRSLAMTACLDIEGGRIAYDVTGAGTLLLLGHGLGHTAMPFHLRAMVRPQWIDQHGSVRPAEPARTDASQLHRAETHCHRLLVSLP